MDSLYDKLLIDMGGSGSLDLVKEKIVTTAVGRLNFHAKTCVFSRGSAICNQLKTWPEHLLSSRFQATY
jgi:hypothetical protein